MQLRTRLLVCVVCVVCVVSLAGSPVGASAEPAIRPRVFLDCQTWCYPDFLRAEVTFVDYVRDRNSADVHVQVTRQQTGARGLEYTLILTGTGRFDGTSHRVRHVSTADETDLERRDGLAEALGLGLVPFATQTELASGLRVVSEPRPAAPQSREDGWDSWVFTVRGDGTLDLEEARTDYTARGRLGADRVTPEWKLSMGLGGRRSESRFPAVEAEEAEEADGSEEVVSTRTETSLSGLAVRSFGDHWGVGGWSWASSSSFQNEDLELGLAPGVEFNVFPYQDYARRELRANLQLQLVRVRYVEPTLFGKSEESLVRPRFRLNFEQRERWGSFNCEAEVSAYLHDPSRYRVQGEVQMSLRVARGLSLRINVEAARIRDQIGLPARDATAEEILLRQRELASGYSLRSWVGLSYSFGSIFNDVVNSRFGD